MTLDINLNRLDEKYLLFDEAWDLYERILHREEMKIYVDDKGHRHLICAKLAEISQIAQTHLLLDVESDDLRKFMLRVRVVENYCDEVFVLVGKVQDRLISQLPKVSPVECLPLEVLLNVFHYLPSPDLISFGLTQKAGLEPAIQTLCRQEVLHKDCPRDLPTLLKAQRIWRTREIDRGRQVLFNALQVRFDNLFFWNSLEQLLESRNRNYWLDQVTWLDLKNPKDGMTMRIPPEIGLFQNLKTILCCGDRLVAIPPQIGQCTALTTLTIRNNLLTELPEEIGDCTALCGIFVDGNRLRKLPSTIGKCKKIESLGLNNNRLESLPDGIGELESLTRLDANCNLITAIPKTIQGCAKLYFLMLEHNQITEIPASLGNCVALQNLYLRDNQIQTVPTELAACPNLTRVDLALNPLTQASDFSNFKAL